ncbi:MAG: PD40 domain-containing protein [Nitrospirae bacterium]|nr:PD40 domain-containing protein [Candidatus Troglogloeales bacterium]
METFPANGDSFASALSADGRFVAFSSTASNLVSGDTNGRSDIFVRDQTTGIIERVSVSSTGLEGNDASNYPAISADGRYVSFSSKASNLVAGDTNGWFDVFVHDRESGETSRVSVNSAGSEGNGNSFPSAISADGRFIAFSSKANNLVSNDKNGTFDLFVHDRQTGATTRVSVDSLGTEGNDFSYAPTIDASGQFVAFSSKASNLVAGDTNGTFDVFMHNMETGETTRISVDSAGMNANGQSGWPAISADGKYVAFSSKANNLVSGDTNDTFDVFMHNMETGETMRVSVDSLGAEANQNGDSVASALSADGRFVAFTSGASNLTPSDTNGTFDVFVHDRESGKTTRVSVNNLGTEGNNASYVSALSADGRVVVFNSKASNLATGDTNGASDIFVTEAF